MNDDGYNDFLITPQMIQTHQVFAAYELGNKSNNSIKKAMVDDLVNYMIDQKLVEFTKSHDVVSDKFTIRARAFVCPDMQVKVLRMNNIEKL